MIYRDFLGKISPKLVGYGALAVIVTSGTVVFLSRMKSSRISARERKKWNSIGKDVVVLHQFMRGNTCINLSPFPIKVETFLRMNNIRYVTETKHFVSVKGKTPWITINGEDIADSQHIIEYLSKHFNIDMCAHLSDEERAVARSMRIMLEDHLYWWGVVLRVYY